MSIDATAGLALIAVLSVAMISVVSKQNAASIKLADSRRAVRLAERVLADLQIGRLVAEAAGMTVNVQYLRDTDAPPNKRWVRVEVKYGDDGSHAVELFGLVPQTAAERMAPTTRGDG